MASITDMLLDLAARQAKQIGQQEQNRFANIQNEYAPETFRRANELTAAQTKKIPAEIQNLLAEAAYRNAETKMVPTKYNIEQQNAATSALNAAISNRVHSPERLKAELDNINSMVEYRKSPGMRNRGMTTFAKARQERMDIENQLREAENTGDTEAAEVLRRDLALAQENEKRAGVDPVLHRRAIFYKNTINTLDEINQQFNNIAQFAGIQGKGMAKFENLASNLREKNPAAFNSYTNYVKTQLPVAAEQIRQSYGASITPEMQHLLTNVLDFTKTGNYDAAVSNWIAANNIIRKEAAPYINALGEQVKPLDTSEYAPQPQAGGPSSAPQLSKEQALQLLKQRGRI